MCLVSKKPLTKEEIEARNKAKAALNKKGELATLRMAEPVIPRKMEIDELKLQFEGGEEGGQDQVNLTRARARLSVAS